MIYLDFETFLITPACQAPPQVCMQFAENDGAAELVHVKDPAFDRLLRWMLESQPLALHKAAFDMACIGARGPEWMELVFHAYEQDRVTCTDMVEVLLLIAEGTYTPKTQTNLQVALERRAPRCGVAIDKSDPWRLKYGTLYDTPCESWDPQARRYALLDAEAERALFRAQHCGQYLPILEDRYRQARAALWFYLIQCWGITPDREAVRKYRAYVAKQLEKDRRLCMEAGLIRPDGVKDMAAAQERLESVHRARGTKPPRTPPSTRFPQGQVQVDADACEKSKDELLMAFTRANQSAVLLGKIDRLDTPVIQASFNPLVNTGRSSCRQGEDPKPGKAPLARGAQLQNLPSDTCADVLYIGEDGLVPYLTRLEVAKEIDKQTLRVRLEDGRELECFKQNTVTLAGMPGTGVRECYKARDGHAINSVDMDTFELRAWAQCCLWELGHSKLAEVLNDPKRDPHVEMGAGLRDISVAAAYALKTLDPKDFKALRGVAKGPNFGLPGGMGWERLIAYCWLSYKVDISPEMAKKACRVWRETWPEAQPYLNKISQRTQGNFNSIVQWGSKRVRGGVGFCDAANGYFQSLAADAIKDAGFQIAKECYTVRSSPLYGCRIVDFVHDEYLVEMPLDRLHEAAWRQTEIQRSVVQQWIPDVLITCRPCAMIHWTKAADEITIGPDGKPCDPKLPTARLVPWRPAALPLAA
jgi:hypothetical protein